VGYALLARVSSNGRSWVTLQFGVGTRNRL
jgi:hypothetical protein